MRALSVRTPCIRQQDVRIPRVHLLLLMDTPAAAMPARGMFCRTRMRLLTLRMRSPTTTSNLPPLHTLSSAPTLSPAPPTPAAAAVSCLFFGMIGRAFILDPDWSKTGTEWWVALLPEL